MLISDKCKMILMLPQKCATSTIQVRLRDIHDVPKYGLNTSYNKELGRLISKHVTLDQALAIEDFRSRSSYLKACFTRNPYDRVYSWFQWIVKNNKAQIEKFTAGEAFGEDEEGNAEANAKGLAIAEKMKERLEGCDYDFNEFAKKFPRIFRPVSIFSHFQGECFMDFVGRVESFEADFAELSRRIDYQTPYMDNANVINQTTVAKNESVDLSSQYIGNYEEQTILKVNEFHVDDFRNFGYTMHSV